VAFDAITLADGRRLRWHEFGDPDGSPVLYTAGTPVSGLGGGAYDEAARAAGLRWVSPDKPGYGGSDYQCKRSVISWGDDLAALAGHLGLDHFALAGESGGAPFTLAAAQQLADQVSGGRPDRGGRARPPGRASGPEGAQPGHGLAGQEHAGAQHSPGRGDAARANHPGEAGA
jgi:pimeloyl-ACP methyl ester carboxylesterase